MERIYPKKYPEIKCNDSFILYDVKNISGFHNYELAIKYFNKSEMGELFIRRDDGTKFVEILIMSKLNVN